MSKTPDHLHLHVTFQTAQKPDERLLGSCSVCGETFSPDALAEGEYFWARPIADGMAKVDNIPFFAHNVHLHDTVRYEETPDGELEVTEVVEQCTLTAFIEYETGKTEKQTKDRYKAIGEYLQTHDIFVEGMVEGMMALALPLDMTKKRLQTIIDRCPQKARLTRFTCP